MKIRFLCLSSLLLNYYSLSTCCIQTATQSTSKTIPFHVEVILDIEPHVGRMCSTCNSVEVEDFYSVNENHATRLVLHNRVSIDLVSSVLTEPGIGGNVPVISFSEIRQLKEMAKNKMYHSKASASIILAYGWKQDIIIYEETDYGSKTVPYLTHEFQKVYISDKILISPLARSSEILEELQKLSTMQTRLFIVHMSARLGSLFFLKAEENGMISDGTAWIIKEDMTSYLSSMEDVINSMSGVIAIHPYVPRTEELEIFCVSMNRELDDGSEPVHDMPISCLHAYDSISATTVAAERVGAHPSSREPKYYYNFMKMSELAKRSLDSELFKEILDSNFNGLSGEIIPLEGKLHSVIWIYTVREVGFWTPTIELSRKFNGTSQVSSNGTSVTGYSINISETVTEALPYSIPCESVSFEEPYAERTGYIDCVQQVLLKKFNATIKYRTVKATIPLFHCDDAIKRSPRPYSVGAAVHAKISEYLNCTTHQALYVIVSLVSTFWLVIYLLLYVFRNSINDFWKRLKGYFHIKHGECSEARVLDGPNMMVSIDPDVFVKDSKQ